MAAENALDASNAAEKLASIIAEIDRIDRDKSAVENLASEKIAAIMAEEERLAEEKSAAERETSEKLAAVMAEEERLAEEKNAAEREASEKMAAVMAEEERLAEEKSAAEREASEKPAAARAEEERLADEERTAAKIIAAEREESARVTAAGVEEMRTESPTAHSSQPTPPPVEYDPSDPFAFMGGSGSGDTSFSAMVSSATPVMFHVDKTMNYVEYSDTKEIVELHRSMNFARITPDGKSPENSSVFICALKKKDEMRVFIPFLLAESGKVLVYVPERQPESSDELAAIISGAVVFTETVGFVMELVTLPDYGEPRDCLIKTIPVLKRVRD